MDPLTDIKPTADIPAHIAIIMDGNGRWGRSRGMQRYEGHVAGVDAVHTVIEAASEIGVRYLTLYAFSTENWNRPKEEVDLLWDLIISVLRRETPELVRNNVRLVAIGDIRRLPEASLKSLNDCLDATAHCTGLQVNLALSYSSRWEITDAVKQIAAEVKAGRLDHDDITDLTVDAHLSTAGIPDPDILIRTGGDKRVSNFLLWQIAYSELYFTDIYWPDFNRETLMTAIKDFRSRERRYGMTSEQIQNSK